jgi:hypothetical protein
VTAPGYSNFLGLSEPLLYRDPGKNNMVLFRAGDLHSVLGDDGEDDISFTATSSLFLISLARVNDAA